MMDTSQLIQACRPGSASGSSRATGGPRPLDPQDAPPHAGHVVRRVLLPGISSSTETAQVAADAIDALTAHRRRQTVKRPAAGEA